MQAWCTSSVQHEPRMVVNALLCPLLALSQPTTPLRTSTVLLSTNLQLQKFIWKKGCSWRCVA